MTNITLGDDMTVDDALAADATDCPCEDCQEQRRRGLSLLATEVQRLREENAVTLEGLRAKQEALVAGNEALLAAEAREQRLLARIARAEALPDRWKARIIGADWTGAALQLEEALKDGEP